MVTVADSGSKDRAVSVEGRNITIWFPDGRVADQLSILAEELRTSSSAVIVELVTKSLPMIRKHQEQRLIRLDGVTVNI